MKSQKAIGISQGSLSMSVGEIIFTPREKIGNAEIIKALRIIGTNLYFAPSNSDNDD